MKQHHVCCFSNDLPRGYGVGVLSNYKKSIEKPVR